MLITFPVALSFANWLQSLVKSFGSVNNSKSIFLTLSTAEFAMKESRGPQEKLEGRKKK